MGILSRRCSLQKSPRFVLNSGSFGLSAGLMLEREALALTIAGGMFADGGSLRDPVFFPFEPGVIDHSAPQEAAIGANGIKLVLTPGFLTEDGVERVQQFLFGLEVAFPEARFHVQRSHFEGCDHGCVVVEDFEGALYPRCAHALRITHKYLSRRGDDVDVKVRHGVGSRLPEDVVWW